VNTKTQLTILEIISTNDHNKLFAFVADLRDAIQEAVNGIFQSFLW